MKIPNLFIACIILNTAAFSVRAQDVIFLHHSIGYGLYTIGNVAAQIDDYNATHGTPYTITERFFPDDPYPATNTVYDYWNLWINNACDNSDPDIACLDGLCSAYDVIIFKHCYPSADILPDTPTPSVSSPEQTISNYKMKYRALRDAMDTYSGNKFIVWTLVPMHRLATTAETAARARQFADWVKNDWLTEDGKEHPNIYVFDFFGYTAESDPAPEEGQFNCLKYRYEVSHSGTDSHPNNWAFVEVGPLFTDFIITTIQDTLDIPVTHITVNGAGGVTGITVGNTLQLSAVVSPANATNPAVTWSILNGTGQASINAGGLVTAITAGTVTAIATAADGSGITGNLILTISEPVILVTNITITGAGGATTITSDNGTLQLSAAVSPSNATNPAITWSIQNGTGQATISSGGLVTAVSNGTVTATASANDGSGVTGSLVITISGQVIQVTGITVTGAGGVTSITIGNTLQLSAAVSPANATNPAVTWSMQNGSGQASINASGLVTASSEGTVTAIAAAVDGSGITGSLVLTIAEEIITVSGITVTGSGGATAITNPGGTLQLSAAVSPSNATNKTVTWSIQNGTGQATMNSTGLVTAVANGTVTATAAATDGSGVKGNLLITISGQTVLVSSIAVTGAGGATTIASAGGTLQLTAAVSPSNATNKNVTWSILNGTGQATMNSTGLVSAVANGTVTATATATDGSGVKGNLLITISGQTVLVSSIAVTGAGGSTTITNPGGTLQLSAAVSPSNATNKTVTWSIQNGTGQATMNSTGLVTALATGTVTATATAADGSGVKGNLVITISGSTVMVSAIVVYGTDFATVIPALGGTLQLHTSILPQNASDKSFSWSVQHVTGKATISSDGLLTATAYGRVTAKATARDGSGTCGVLEVRITDHLPTGVELPENKSYLTKQDGSALFLVFKPGHEYKEIHLYSLSGNLLHRGQIISNPEILDISSMLPGLYVIKLITETGISENIKFSNW